MKSDDADTCSSMPLQATIFCAYSFVLFAFWWFWLSALLTSDFSRGEIDNTLLRPLINDSFEYVY